MKKVLATIGFVLAVNIVSTFIFKKDIEYINNVILYLLFTILIKEEK